MSPRLCFLIASSALLSSAFGEIDFAHEIVPVLREHCAECHSGEKRKGGFSLNTRAELLEGSENGPVITPGDLADSYLLELVTTTEKDIQMPPKGDRVPADQVAKLREWIEADLPWEPGFAFAKPAYEPPLKPRTPELPAAKGGRDNPIDRILDAYLAQGELPTPEPVEDDIFLRRVYLDVIGLLPTPAERSAFLKSTSENKRQELINDLLSRDVAYADHWLSFWNDLLRNDYTGTGFITKGRSQITTWLYRSLLDNKAYDLFVRELLAPPSDGSAGFIQGIKWRGDVNASQTIEVQFAQNLSQVFLGINMKCASCHDSFIDSWKLKDAYSLAAIYSTEPLEIHRCDKPTGEMAQAGWIFPELGSIDSQLPQEERLEQLAELMTHPENGRLTRTIVNRLWHRLMGRGIVHPVDAMDTEPWNADLLDFLASDLAAHDYDLKHTLQLILSSQAYQSQVALSEEAADAENYVYAGPIPKRLTAEQLIDAVWQLTGTAPPQADAQTGKLRGETTVRASLVKSDFLMRSLGRPNREQVVTTRPAQLTTLQAIDLSNGDILADLLQNGATNLQKRDFKDASTFVNWLYEYALSRPPSASELDAAVAFAGEEPDAQALEDLLWAVLMMPEFQMVR